MNALADAARAEPFSERPRLEQAAVVAEGAIDWQIDRSVQMAREILHRAARVDDHEIGFPDALGNRLRAGQKYHRGASRPSRTR